MDSKNKSKYSLFQQFGYMLAISIAIVLLSFFFIKIYSRHGKEYAIPTLKGLTIEDASELPNADFFEYVIIDSIFLPSKKQGEILTQDPPEQSKAKKGRTIYLTIAAYNPEKIEVPNLIDLTLRQAISQLDAVGLQGGKLTFVEDISRNAILKQTYKGKAIPENEKITKGEMIDLVVGKGLENEIRTVVPNVIGKTPEHARRDILSASLNVGKEFFPKREKKAEVRVLKQSPVYKSSSGLGQRVDLWYSVSANFDKLAKDAEKADTISDFSEEEVNQENADW